MVQAMTDIQKSPLLVRGGTLVLPDGLTQQDFVVVNGQITTMGLDLQIPESGEILQVDNRLILPGCIDSHVHFGLRAGGRVTCDDFTSGSLAAVHGGVTTVIDYMDPVPGTGLAEAYALRRGEADGKIYTDYSLHAVLTDWTDHTRVAMQKLVAEGITSVKLFMVYDQRVDDKTLMDVLAVSRGEGFLVTTHCESSVLLEYFLNQARNSNCTGIRQHCLSRPPCVEAEAVARVCALATAVSAPLHVVHISSGAAVDELVRFRQQNPGISGETAPHYLALTDEVFDREDGHLFASCPQIKGDADRSKLRKALLTGELSFIATDHCAYTRAQKDEWMGDFTQVPQGIPAVETSLPVVFTELVQSGALSLPDLVQRMSTRPAKRYGMYPRKGTLLPGSDADFLVIDPDARRQITGGTLSHPAGWSPFAGRDLAGFPEAVFLRGKCLLKNGQVTQVPQGIFIPRNVPGEC